MKLAALLRAAGITSSVDAPNDITKITADSRAVEPGALFVAIRGTTGDGHAHVAAALARGATAVIAEDASGPGPIVVVPNTRVALDRLATAFYDAPARELRLVGITGTNGKTTIAYMLERILTTAGLPTGVLGTIDHHLGARAWASGLTTPDPVTLQARLREFVTLGARAAAFEISSHALAQSRADSLPLDVGVFTNLTRDHLDYHGDLESYFAIKELMFTRLLGRRAGGVAVLNGEDARVKLTRVAPGVTTWLFGEGQFDFGFTILNEDLAGTRFALASVKGSLTMTLPCPGRHNVANAVAAIAAACALGVEAGAGSAALESFRGAPGRLEGVPNARGLFLFVDYAHTDDALRSILASLRRVRDARHAGARIITVFGCGGDRDRGKRPLMAAAAAGASDVVILTSDNPRTEDPARILDEIQAGVPVGWRGEVFREVDRREALRRALQCAVKGDVILVAGKGHEDYQIIGERRLPFSDQNVLAELLKD